MKIIYGLDFTSAPRPSKPMYLVRCELDDHVLRVINFRTIKDWSSFDAWLIEDAESVAGLDFPFGQPREFIENMSWETNWTGYVKRVGEMSMSEWLAALQTYRDTRPAGDKHHLRKTDSNSGAISPMMVYGVPVGRMFFQGAPRLLNAGVCIIPNHPTSSPKIVLETYPKLVVQRIGVGSYKSDTKTNQSATYRMARQQIVEAIRSEMLREFYGVSLYINDEQAQQCIDDPKADRLDSVLCAIQAAWAYRQSNYGVPENCDTLEGWIVDPEISAS